MDLYGNIEQVLRQKRLHELTDAELALAIDWCFKIHSNTPNLQRAPLLIAEQSKRGSIRQSQLALRVSVAAIALSGLAALLGILDYCGDKTWQTEQLVALRTMANNAASAAQSPSTGPVR